MPRQAGVIGRSGVPERRFPRPAYQFDSVFPAPGLIAWKR
jgi:hypothetical protein